MTDIKASNRIYITYKARMAAEAKLRLYSRVANLLVVWFSFCMIVASIGLASDSITIEQNEIFFASASVAIFASSVFLASGVLEKRANEFRSCYLELQKIWNSSVNENEKMRRYGDVLESYPNHSSRDDADVIFDTHYRGGLV